MSIIGQRIFELRSERVPRLTQRALAERAGLSVDVIQKLEQGRKSSARITTLTAIAAALDVDLSGLLGKPTRLESVPLDGGLLALRRALTPVAAGSGEPVPAQELRDAVDEAWSAYWRGDYDVLVGFLPSLINDVRVSDAMDLLAEACQIAACVLVHLGHSDLSLLAVDKALAMVEDPLLKLGLAGTSSWILLNQGRAGDAAAFAVREADQAEPRRGSSAAKISMWGNLLVTAATAAARDGRDADAQELLRDAQGAAVRIGEERNDYQTHFGVSQVMMQRVDIAVVAGDYTRALDVAEEMPPDARLPLAALARHRTDVAHAQARLGRHRDAAASLLGVERMAPRWIRYQVFPRAVVGDLLRARRPSSVVRGLARRLGVE